MQVVLRQDVDNLGLRGEVVNVARGYARNFLLPRGLAELGDAGSRPGARAARRRCGRVTRRRRSTRRGRSPIALEAEELRFDVSAGPTGSLFGSVTATNVADRLWEERKIRIDRRKLGLTTIKRIGRYTVDVERLRRRHGRAARVVAPEGGELPPEEELEAAAAAEAEAAEAEAAAAAAAERPRPSPRSRTSRGRGRAGRGDPGRVEAEASSPSCPTGSRPRAARSVPSAYRPTSPAAGTPLTSAFLPTGGRRRDPSRHADSPPVIHRAVDDFASAFSTARPRAVDFSRNFPLRAGFSSTVTSGRSANICSVMPANRPVAEQSTSPFPHRCGPARRWFH